MPEFTPFPKIARLNREIIVTILVLVIPVSAQASSAAAPPVCAKLSMSKVAAQSNRIAYLTRLLPEARNAGYGIGPMLTLEIRALKSGNHVAAARYMGLVNNACKRASA